MVQTLGHVVGHPHPKENTMKHAIRCIRQALRHPGAAIRGAAEFRTDLTSHYDDPDVLESYDSGRELAHIATARRYDQAW